MLASCLTGAPGRGGGIGSEWAVDSLKGDAPHGSGMLAGCPSLKKNWRRTWPMQKKKKKKHLKGKDRWNHAAVYSLAGC